MDTIPELTKDLADSIALTARTQLRTSRTYKNPRMKDIGESEDLYFGIVKKQARNPFNESFPFMSGFVDGLMAKLDDLPNIEFSHTDEADYVSAQKYQALFDQQVNSTLPEAQWALKDRWCRKLALFSGVGIYCLYGESSGGQFKLHFDVKDYYDFHCEPGGGGNLESHLFCGEENIFKSKEDLLAGVASGHYDMGQVDRVLGGVAGPASTAGSKDNASSDGDTQRLNRHRGLGLDPQTNNYVGQDIYKFCQWYLVFKGIRWYCLFEENTGTWIRVKALRELFPVVPETGDALWPYVAWHTNEEARVFWSKAPCDDARPIARNVNRLLNQELYNREKKNNGQRAYDPEMYHDLESLMDNRPDGLTPFDSKGGTRSAAQGIHTFEVGEITGTLELVTYLDAFTSSKTGTQTKTENMKPSNQKVGVYFGELKQIEERVSLYNKSFKEAWAQLGYRFIQAVDDHVTKPIQIQMMGADGIEWSEFTAKDKQRNRDFNIRIIGGSEELQESLAKNAKKLEGLPGIATANPRWKDTQMMKAMGYTDDEIKDAFSTLTPASKELMAEAAKAVDDIARGKTPSLNYSANVTFCQKLMDLALEINDLKVQNKIYEYITSHAKIVAQNEARSVAKMIGDKNIAQFNSAPTINGMGPDMGPTAPVAPVAPALPAQNTGIPVA